MSSVSVEEMRSSSTSHLSPRRNSMMYRSMGEEWLAGGSHVSRTPCWVRLAVRHRGGVRSTSGSGVPRGEPADQEWDAINVWTKEMDWPKLRLLEAWNGVASVNLPTGMSGTKWFGSFESLKAVNCKCRINVALSHSAWKMSCHRHKPPDLRLTAEGLFSIFALHNHTGDLWLLLCLLLRPESSPVYPQYIPLFRIYEQCMNILICGFYDVVLNKYKIIDVFFKSFNSSCGRPWVQHSKMCLNWRILTNFVH